MHRCMNMAYLGELTDAKPLSISSNVMMLLVSVDCKSVPDDQRTKRPALSVSIMAPALDLLILLNGIISSSEIETVTSH